VLWIRVSGRGRRIEMFEVVSRRRRVVGGRKGPDARRIKRGGVVGIGCAGATIWGATR
jgi:hypothetical protein